MSVDGRIGNRALLQAAAEALQIEGIRRMPTDVDRSNVKFVYILGSEAAAGNYASNEQWVSGEQPRTLLAPAAFIEGEIVGPEADPPACLPDGFRYRIETLGGQLVMPVGHSLDNLYLRARLYWAGGAGQGEIATFHPVNRIRAGRLTYKVSLSGGASGIDATLGIVPVGNVRPWSGLVETDHVLRLKWDCTDPFGVETVTNLPTNTSMSVWVEARKGVDGAWPAP